MSNKSAATMNDNSIIVNLIGWLFGVLFLTIGLINLFWGNDPGFGIFIITLSLIFFPPFTSLVKEKVNVAIPGFVKILVGVFILWAALGVGELFDKIDMMRNAL